MRFYHFEIVIEKEPDDEGYSAYSPSLPGCFSNGRTIEEAKRNMREAIQQHVAALLAHWRHGLKEGFSALIVRVHPHAAARLAERGATARGGRGDRRRG